MHGRILLLLLLLLTAAGAAVAEDDGPLPAAAASPPRTGAPLPQIDNGWSGGPPPDAPAQPPAQIVWRVENPFRLFLDPADTDMHRLVYAGLSPQERAQPVISAERRLAERFPYGWAEAVWRKTCWRESDHRYTCKTEPDYINPASHRVIVELRGGGGDPNARCTWLTAPLAAKGTVKGRGQSLPAECGTPVVLDIPYPHGVELSVESEGRIIAQTTVQVRDAFVVALGDSYGSGDGNPDQPVRFDRERTADYGKPPKMVELFGYPARRGPWHEIGDPAFIEANARWLDQACHRSLYSHQLRVALQLAIEDPHRAITFVSFACAGAEVTEGLFLHYKGHEWVPQPPDRSQISAAADAQCGHTPAQPIDLPDAYQLAGRLPELKQIVLDRCDRGKARPIDLLLLSIGGNDSSFSRLVANAVLADEGYLRWIGGWMGQVYNPADADRELEQLEDRYKSLRRALHNILHMSWDEPDRVILTGYPPMSLLEDGRTVCQDGQAGMQVVPEFELSEAKARQGEVLAARLNRTMREAAQQNGWSFVDKHRQQFAGHGVCASAGAMQLVDDLGFPRKLGTEWVPFNPADYQPYATRARWFRTPNDAFLTGNFHVAASLAQKVLKIKSLSWVQLLLAATYSGAFHPNAEGQAVMADAVTERARAVLARYESRPRSPGPGARAERD